MHSIPTHILLLILLIAGYGRVQAQNAGEKAYEELQILSGRSLTASSQISEDSIIHLARRIEAAAQASGNIVREFKAGQIQVNAYGLKGNFGLASNKAQQMLEKAHRKDNTAAMGLAMQAIGDIYMHSDRFARADSIFTEAQPLITKQGDSYMLLQLLLQRLHVYMNLNDTTQGQKVFQQAKTLLNTDESIPKKEDYDFQLSCYEAIHMIHTGDTIRSRKLLERLESEKKRVNAPNFWLHIIHAQYYLYIGQYDKAIAHSDSSLMAAYAEPNRNILLHDLQFRSRLMEAIGKTDLACETYHELIALNDSLFQTQYATQIDSLHLTYWVDQIQMSNIVRRSALYTRMIVGLVLLVIVTAVVVLIIRRKNRKLEESRHKLEAMREATADSIRSKSLFLSNMSHELRTPLNAIVGFTMILTESGEGEDDETQQQCSSYIRQNAELLTKLINDVIDFSGLKGETIRFTFAPCNVVELCRNVLETVGNVKRTQAQMYFETDLDQLELLTDNNRLQQVLINLLVNATKFTSEGRITLRLHTDVARDEVVFTVEDTGCGIPKEKQGSIFERFEKLHEGKQGAGLGLSICQLIVEYVGGRIWIDPDYTGGTRILFTHPLHYTPKENRP